MICAENLTLLNAQVSLSFNLKLHNIEGILVRTTTQFVCKRVVILLSFHGFVGLLPYLPIFSYKHFAELMSKFHFTDTKFQFTRPCR